MKMGRKPLFVVAEAPASICCSKNVKKEKWRADLNAASLYEDFLAGDGFLLADVLW